MAANKSAILSWLADLCAAIVTDTDDLADVSARISAATDLGSSDFARESLSLMRIISESVETPAGFDRLAIPAGVSGQTAEAMTIMLAMGLAIAGCRAEWPSRPLARRARAGISEVGSSGLAAIDQLGGDGADLFAWLASLTAVSCRLISDIAANAAPIVKIKTGISLPSTVLAYQLYGDAKRAGDLVDIAGASTPLVIPTLFDALAR